MTPGQYNVRLNTAAGVTVGLSATLVVVPPPTVGLSSTSIVLGATITATIADAPATSAYDWVGFYPAANSFSGYVYAKYLNDSSAAPSGPLGSGSITFTVLDLPAGEYNIRLNTAAGVTVATSATIALTVPTIITLSATTIVQGESLTATIANAPATSRYDWVGFYPVGNTISGYLQEKYLNNQATAPESPLAGGTVTFATTPSLAPGEYNVRLNTASPVTVAVSATVTVEDSTGSGTLDAPVASPLGGMFAQAPEVTLTAQPDANIRYTFDGSEPTAASTLYSGPVTIPQNGATLKARAFKAGWGDSETFSAVYEIDSVPPYLTVTSPSPGVLVPPGSLTIQGTVLELFSTVIVTCDGDTADVSDNAFSCEVVVPSGTSTVDIIATDLTGNMRTVVLGVTTSDQIGAEPTALRITPQHVTLGVGQTRQFRAIDNLGRVPSDAEWTVDNETLATLSTVNGVELTGVAAGEVTLTATWHGQSAASTVTIVTAIVAGTTLWSNPPLLIGGAVDDVVRGATAPDGRRLLYAVERQGETSVLRAFDPGGQEIWGHNLAGRVEQLSGDPLGGAVVLVRTNGTEYPPLREVQAFTPDGRSTLLTAADSPGFAIHPDGPLYVVVGQQLTAFDLGLGHGRTVALPTGTGGETLAGVPTVLADGSVTLPLRVWGGVHSPGESLDLFWLRPSGAVDVYPVDRDPTGFYHTFWVRPYKAIPNGLGGVLVAYDLQYYFAFPYSNVRIRLVNADGSLGGGSSWGGTNQFSSWLTDGFTGGGLVLGEGRVRATNYRFNSQGTYVRVSDISLDGYGMTDFYVQGGGPPRFTALEGGAFFESYADGSTWGPHPDHESVQLANAIEAGAGMFLGSEDEAVTLRIGGALEAADSEWAVALGNQQAQNAPRQLCAVCHKGYRSPVGKDPIAQSENRRVLTVAIDGSWDQPGNPGQTVVRIFNAVTAAIQQWNSARDEFGSPIGYYFYLDSSHTLGAPDVTIEKAVCTNSDFACLNTPIDSQGTNHALPSIMRLHEQNITVQTVRDQDLVGRIAHELGHKLGGHGAKGCDTTPSIMRGNSAAGNGRRYINEVSTMDVELVNQARLHPNSCTGVDGDDDEQAEEQESSQAANRTYLRPFRDDSMPVARTGVSAQSRTADHRLRSSSQRVGILFTLIVTLVLGQACRKVDTPSTNGSGGRLSQWAAQAKTRGDTRIGLRETTGYDTESAFQEVLTNSGLLIATAGESKMLVTPDYIFTWQFLMADEWLRRFRTQPVGICGGPMPPTTAANTFVIKLAKGSATIDGVEITISDEQALNFEPGQRYLLMVRECPGYLVRPWGHHGIFEVGGDGRISLPPFNPGTATYAREIISLGRIDAVRAKITSTLK